MSCSEISIIFFKVLSKFFSMTFPDILNLNNFNNDTSTCKPSTSKESPKISYASIAAKKWVF